MSSRFDCLIDKDLMEAYRKSLQLANKNDAVFYAFIKMLEQEMDKRGINY
ncbi:hypothetical protein [Peribacillus sp. SCS-155]